MAGRGIALLRRTDRSANLVEQLKALTEAVDLCDGRVPAEVLTEARRVVNQADRRLSLSGSATVVALAGATGSGKSSTFNALSGTELATVGVRRPTTAHAMAVTWGEDAAEDLLDWLQIPRRHVLERDPASAGLDGLVLLDLPDHDSTEVQHRLEVDRLVQLVDMLIWVLDPQKYADAAVHERYLIPLAQHAEVMLIVLNQADTLSPTEREQCLTDLRRLLAAEGLGRVEVIAFSAVTGEGMDALRARLARQVADKQTAARRLAADVAVAASALADASGRTKITPAGPLQHRPAEHPGRRGGGRAGGDRGRGPGVATARRAGHRLAGARLGGEVQAGSAAAAASRPARRRTQRKEIDPSGVGRTSLPATSGVQQSRVDTALRALADQAAQGLTRGWVNAIKQAARSARAHPARPSRPGDRQHRSRSAATPALVAAGPGAAVAAGRLRWWPGSAGWPPAAVLAYLQLPPLPPITWWGCPRPPCSPSAGCWPA